MPDRAEQIVLKALDKAIAEELNLGEVAMAFIVTGVVALTRKTPMIALDMIDRITDECRSANLAEAISEGSA